MLKRWLTGWDLRDRWDITQSDLADLILSGELTAFEQETLTSLDVQKERDYISYLHHNPNAPERALIPTLIERAFTLSFRFSDVAEFEKLNGIVPHETASGRAGKTMGTTVQESEAPVLFDNENNRTLSVAAYIKQRRNEGANDEKIAFELYDKKGNFKLTDLEIARSLGLTKNLQPGQVDAMKQRARRARIKGETLSQKQRVVTV